MARRVAGQMAGEWWRDGRRRQDEGIPSWNETRKRGRERAAVAVWGGLDPKIPRFQKTLSSPLHSSTAHAHAHARIVFTHKQTVVVTKPRTREYSYSEQTIFFWVNRERKRDKWAANPKRYTLPNGTNTKTFFFFSHAHVYAARMAP